MGWSNPSGIARGGGDDGGIDATPTSADMLESMRASTGMGIDSGATSADLNAASAASAANEAAAAQAAAQAAAAAQAQAQAVAQAQAQANAAAAAQAAASAAVSPQATAAAPQAAAAVESAPTAAVPKGRTYIDYDDMGIEAEIARMNMLVARGAYTDEQVAQVYQKVFLSYKIGSTEYGTTQFYSSPDSAEHHVVTECTYPNIRYDDEGVTTPVSNDLFKAQFPSSGDIASHRRLKAMVAAGHDGVKYKLKSETIKENTSRGAPMSVSIVNVYDAAGGVPVSLQIPALTRNNQCPPNFTETKRPQMKGRAVGDDSYVERYLATVHGGMHHQKRIYAAYTDTEVGKLDAIYGTIADVAEEFGLGTSYHAGARISLHSPALIYFIAKLSAAHKTGKFAKHWREGSTSLAEVAQFCETTGLTDYTRLFSKSDCYSRVIEHLAKDAENRLFQVDTDVDNVPFINVPPGLAAWVGDLFMKEVFERIPHITSDTFNFYCRSVHEGTSGALAVVLRATQYRPYIYCITNEKK